MTDALGRAHGLLGCEPEVVTRAPGRVNLIGEHTDYNDGFVLPMAVPFDTVVAGVRTAPGSGVVIEAEGFGAARFDPDDPLVGGEPWSLHLRGVHALLADRGVEIPAWRGVVATDIPVGASLSSSAAVEVSVALAVLTLAGGAEAAGEWSGQDLARLGQRVENEIVGVPSGIMDQLISATARAGHANLIDCRSLGISPVPLPRDHLVVVMDTGTRRELATSAFGDRQHDCQAAARQLGVASLRDATLEQITQELRGRVARRARHVVAENERTVAAAACLRAGDVEQFGALMSASHHSLATDYEVSGPALDAMVEAAVRSPGCVGARMTGGGFAGCAVALVRAAEIDRFLTAAGDHYRRVMAVAPQLWAISAGAGAQVLHPGQG